ncbi:trigger factor [Mycoplasma sp. Pen4]|uniref:trigger factor n=1 Tax=Mycoplasma sp. Pen4 TaxID=640330 RepID=UPI0016545C6F|nr:trigger factor [Mycoplasma sp. Pen4]QNM93415.1 trigger factor [Mycoplasma sp. Pen4]
MQKIKHTVNNEKAELTVSYLVEKEVFDKKLEENLEALAKNVKIKGYRAGTAPIEKRKQAVNPDKLFEVTARYFNDIHSKDIFEYIKNEKIEISSYPFVSFDLKEEGFMIEFKFIIQPKFDEADMSKFTYEYKDIKATEKDIEDAIKELETNLSTELEIKEGTTLEGDKVIIDFKGFIDDEAFEGGEAKGYALTLGSKTFINGFEDQLVNKEIGWEGDVVVTFPQDYFVKEYRGKEAVFQVKINSVRRANPVKLTDEVIKGFNDPKISSVEEFKATLAENIKVRKFIENNVEFYTSVVDQLIENANPVVHEKLLEPFKAESKKQFENSLKQYGIKKQEYLHLIKSTEDDLDKEFEKEALKQVLKMEAHKFLTRTFKVEATEDQIKTFTDEFVKFGFGANEAANFVNSSLRMSLILAKFKPELAEKLEKDFVELTQSKEEK